MPPADKLRCTELTHILHIVASEPLGHPGGTEAGSRASGDSAMAERTVTWKEKKAPRTQMDF